MGHPSAAMKIPAVSSTRTVRASLESSSVAERPSAPPEPRTGRAALEPGAVALPVDEPQGEFPAGHNVYSGRRRDGYPPGPRARKGPCAPLPSTATASARMRSDGGRSNSRTIAVSKRWYASSAS